MLPQLKMYLFFPLQFKNKTTVHTISNLYSLSNLQVRVSQKGIADPKSKSKKVKSYEKNMQLK